MDFNTKTIAKQIDEYNEELDNQVIVFLKENGYRPKPTAKYMKSLHKRLNKKGIKLINKQKMLIHGTFNERLGFETIISLVRIEDNYTLASSNIKISMLFYGE